MENRLIVEPGIPIPPRTKPKPEGACTNCSRLAAPGLQHCRTCLDRIKGYRDAHKAAGWCAWGSGICKETPAFGRTMCDDHLKVMLDYSNERRESRKTAKICIDCGALPQFWGLRCMVCRLSYVDDPLPPSARTALKKYRRLEQIDARRAQAETAIQHLADERLIQVLTMRHGLLDGADRTLQEIGATLSVTRERVRQIETAALKIIESQGVDVSLLRPPFSETQRSVPAKRRHLVSSEQRKKANCHRLVSEAIQEGKIIKQPCYCGEVNSVAHHHDYDKPLEVEWLCRIHHMEAHRGYWLDNASPQGEMTQRIVNILKSHHLTVAQIQQATGIAPGTLKKIIKENDSVRDKQVLTLLRFCESLNGNGAVK